jgi:hypothetical protein
VPYLTYIIATRRIYSNLVERKIRISAIPIEIVVDELRHLLFGEIILALGEFRVSVIHKIVIPFEFVDELGKRKNEPLALHTFPAVVPLPAISEDVDVLDAVLFVDVEEIHLFGARYRFELSHNNTG